jgi:hypothetical protein
LFTGNTAILSANLAQSVGLPLASGITGFGTGIASALAVNTGSTGSVVLYNGALGTPTSGTLTNATGLPVSTGISGLGTGVATALAAGVTGSGNIALATSPTFVTPTLGVASATQINIGTVTYPASNAFSSFQSSANSYAQVVLQNSSTGTQASADFIVSNADSTDGFLYGDFGINGPNFAGTGAFNTANNVYMYASNTDMVIGTTSANAVHFVVNNGATDAMTINSSGVVSLGTALAYGSGGTGSTSYTTGTMLVAGSSGFQSLANSSFTATGSGAANNTVTSFTVDAYGRSTALTYTAISGLTVGQGGTGASSFNTNGIVYGGSSLSSTVAAGTSDQTWSNQILTVTNVGVPVWSSALDGGTF